MSLTVTGRPLNLFQKFKRDALAYLKPYILSVVFVSLGGFLFGKPSAEIAYLSFDLEVPFGN